MKKFLHKIAIEYPIISVLLFLSMLILLYEISINNSIYKYQEFQECSVKYKNDEYYTIIICDKKYYDEIRLLNKAFWYSDSEQIYDAVIKEINLMGDGCHISINVFEEDFIKESAANITIKLCYAEETIFDHIFEKWEKGNETEKK